MSNNVRTNAPAQDWGTCTPSDSTVLTDVRSLYIGVSGDVAVVSALGHTNTFKSVSVGILPVACVKVLSTGTTATDILLLY